MQVEVKDKSDNVLVLGDIVRLEWRTRGTVAYGARDEPRWKHHSITGRFCYDNERQCFAVEAKNKDGKLTKYPLSWGTFEKVA